MLAIRTWTLGGRRLSAKPGPAATDSARSFDIISLTPMGAELCSVIALVPDAAYVSKLVAIVGLADIEVAVDLSEGGRLALLDDRDIITPADAPKPSGEPRRLV